jgi:hypothetical protein
MRRFAVTLVLGCIALAGFLYIQPRLTMRVLADSLRSSDTAAIRERLDAERVRESLRAEYLGRLGHPPTNEDRESAVVRSLVLFSRGLEMIMATLGDGEQHSAELTDWTFETASRVHATLRQGDAPSITVVLERDGTSWQLVAMQPSSHAWRELE